MPKIIDLECGDIFQVKTEFYMLIDLVQFNAVQLSSGITFSFKESEVVNKIKRASIIYEWGEFKIKQNKFSTGPVV